MQTERSILCLLSSNHTIQRKRHICNLHPQQMWRIEQEKRRSPRCPQVQWNSIRPRHRHSFLVINSLTFLSAITRRQQLCNSRSGIDRLSMANSLLSIKLTPSTKRIKQTSTHLIINHLSKQCHKTAQIIIPSQSKRTQKKLNLQRHQRNYKWIQRSIREKLSCRQGIKSQ